MPVVMLAGLLTDADKEAREALQPRECLEKRLHQQGYLRVRPRSLREITQFPHHQAERGQVHERQRIAEAIFKVLGQPTTPIEPRNRALDNPAFR